MIMIAYSHVWTLINNYFQANLGEKEELTFEEFRTVMAAYKKDIEKANLAVTQTKQ